jgi:CheY-like chemotaxis protein/anti-sigma regulatory factor (Ser/Thr protein kinase)
MLPDAPVWLIADAVRLTQVFGNLLDNASKFTKADGHIEVSAELTPEEVIVRVRDDGIGMEEAWLPQIFDLFTQASASIDRSQGGLGLGLTLAKTLVEMHDGKIYADSEGLGNGSVFTVRLPLASAVSQDNSPPMLTTLPESRRVLVVDDGIGAAKMLQMLVSRLGPHEVEIAHDGPSALDKAQHFSPDLVLLDIGLPRMDGYEVARRLRDDAALNGATLVAVTGYGQDEDKRKSQEAGFHEHVVKPIDLDTLKKLLTYPKRETAAP